MLILIGLCGVAIVYGMGRLIYLYKAHQRREKERQEQLQARLDQIRETHREALRKTRAVNSQPISKPTAHAAFVGNTDKMVTDKPKPSYAPSPTQSVKSDDGFFDGVVTGYMVNSLLNSTHKSGGDNPIDFPSERSVGVSKSESSWGFDDADSRKSISDSMDTSSSYSSSSSSSSDSWSSSSDSGPSSDW